MFYIIPGNILYAAKIFSSAHNYFDHILGGPLTFIWVRGNLFGCADIYLPALTIFMLARIFYVDPQTFWCPAKHFGVPAEIYLLRKKYFPTPKIFCVSCADFLVLPFFGLPVCLDYVNDPLLATSAL